MSYEELEEHNVFLPEEARGKADLHTTINQPLMLAVLIFGGVSCVLMWWGNGMVTTWVGSGLFIVFMYIFTIFSNTGIDKQNQEVDELIRKNR